MRAALPPIFGYFSRLVFSVLVGQMSLLWLRFDGKKSAAKGAKTRSNRIEIVGPPARATRDIDAVATSGAIFALAVMFSKLQGRTHE